MNATSQLVSQLVSQFALAALVVFGTGVAVHGNTVTWADSSVSGDWDDGTKWTGGSAPQTTDLASITGQDGVAVDLNGNRSITGLSLTGPSTGMFTFGDAGDTLTLLANSKVTVKDRVTVNANLAFTNITDGTFISATSSSTAERNTYVFNGDIDLGTYGTTAGGSRPLFAISNAAHPSHATFNGVISGDLNAGNNSLFTFAPGANGSVTLNGDNTFTLTGYTYVGMNIINATSWTLNLGHSNALGNTNALGVSRPVLRFNSSDTGAGTSLAKAIVNLTQDGMVVQNTFFLRNASAAQLSGTVAGHTTWAGNVTLGANGHTDGVSVLPMTFSAIAGNTTTISGLISGTATASSRPVPVIVAGDGNVQFTRAEGNTYIGGTTVKDGTLLVNNTSGSGTGTGAVLVEDGGTLFGVGIVSGATTIEVGGTLAPGTNGVGTLTFGSNLTLEGTLQVTAHENGSTTRAAVGGALDLTGATLLVADIPSKVDNGVNALIVASYDSLEGTFADVQGTLWDIDYNYLGNKQIAILPPPLGTLICIR